MNKTWYFFDAKPFWYTEAEQLNFINYIYVHMMNILDILCSKVYYRNLIILYIGNGYFLLINHSE